MPSGGTSEDVEAAMVVVETRECVFGRQVSERSVERLPVIGSCVPCRGPGGAHVHGAYSGLSASSVQLHHSTSLVYSSTNHVACSFSTLAHMLKEVAVYMFLTRSSTQSVYQDPLHVVSVSNCFDGWSIAQLGGRFGGSVKTHLDYNCVLSLI